MRIPMPFPRCPKCGEDSPNSYHDKPGCHGLLVIDPDTEIVSCTSCCDSWLIWKTNYRCKCGYEFEARAVKSAVDKLVDDCKLCAEYLDIQEKAYWKRTHNTIDSKEFFIRKLLEEFGHSIAKMTGYALTKLFEFFKGIFV